MGARTGTADLPLHGGRVPAWLAGRMARLARVVCEAIVHHYGRDELLARLAHPFWFQSFGAVMGMDWHSSGITTSVVGALKRGLAPIGDELGIAVCGGRGRHSRRTPAELVAFGARTGVDGDALARTSRLVAKVDNAAVQDGFQLYLHTFIVTVDGAWVVVQQGMNGPRRQARRYHWLSRAVTDFVVEPHAAIDGPAQGTIRNLTDRRAAAARAAGVELAAAPDRVLRHLAMPRRHDVRAADVNLARLRGALVAAAARAPADFADLLLVPGVGPRTVEALALVAEIVHGAPSRFSDPARFSYAHGGKDGHPFPVPTRVYDETIRVLRQAVDRAKLGNDDKLAAIRRLDREARRLERAIAGGDWREIVARQWRASHRLGGRAVSATGQPASDVAGAGDRAGARSAPGTRSGRPPEMNAPGRAPSGRARADAAPRQLRLPGVS
ncbi:MAG: DUF763 domain-containing protein [Deltaproteobacteria bacterium]|nr:MAG: DUF763 domain-containing protein [Deltaproteobacteria bacterium]